jgi:2-methylaconitate cis-trans-isomerase PrpF
MRGGTSKGVFFRKEVLPSPGRRRDETILRIFGSGDPMQLDGLGGAQVQSSKTMIVSRSKRKGVDIDYLFGQVSVEGWFVDYMGNCGNLTSAIAPFAIDEGLIRVRGSEVRVRLYNVNTKKRVDAIVPLEHGKTKYEGDYMIDGVPRPGSRIDVIWYEPGGAVSGKLLPTGNVVDTITADGRSVRCSIVDAANPVVFVKAEQVGLKGIELPNQVSRESLDLLEAIRSEGARRMGLVENAVEATKKTPHMPFIAVVAARQDYVSSGGKSISKESYGVLARLFSMQKMHHAYAATGAICTAAASKIPGSVVNEVAEVEGETVVIGHPKGLIDLGVSSRPAGNSVLIESVKVGRTAKRLMSGLAYY